MTVYDAIGIGFGPSNMAIAIALEEELAQARPSLDPRRALNIVFLEQQEEFSWHPHMLLKGADMQISYLKDLATPRNPRSHYSFINYIHRHGRFNQFLNLKSFNPSRIEFNEYLRWAARELEPWVSKGESVVDVHPVLENGQIHLLKVVSRRANGERVERLARNLITSVGGTPRIPAFCAEVAGDGRVFHSHRYLQMIEENRHAKRIAVIGAGQSAAEIFMDLATQGDKEVDLIARTYAPKPADETPFVNRIFDDDFVEHMYNLGPAQRIEFLNEFRHANYACVDVDLLGTMNRLLYDEGLARPGRFNLLLRQEVQRIHPGAKRVDVQLACLNTGEGTTRQYDAIVLATGYERKQHEKLLQPISSYVNDFSVDRYYRLKTRREFKPSIFVLGANEATHGLSDTLLSLTAVRAHGVSQLLLSQLFNTETKAA